MGRTVADVLAEHQPGYTETDLAAALDEVLTARADTHVPTPSGDPSMVAAELAVLVVESLTAAEVAEHLGLPVFTVERYAADGDLYAVDLTGQGTPRFPLWQFANTDDGLLPYLGVVLRITRDTVHPLALTRWMTTPDDPYTVEDGVRMSPRVWLVTGGDPTPVLNAAAALNPL